MSRTIARSLMLVLVVTASGAHATTLDVSRLAWMAGRWTGVQDGIAMEEHWTSPAGGALVGMHKDVRNGRMISFEFFRIIATGKDSVCYLTSPRGAPPTPFCLAEAGHTRVVFENRAHDFPQRILYWLDDQERLHARIEGVIQGETQSEEWTWTRVPEGAPRIARPAVKPGSGRP